MPNPPTLTPGTEYRTETEEDRETVAKVVDPLIGRMRWEAWRELMNGKGNAFAVGGSVSGKATTVGAWDFLSRPLGREEVANLVAWLLMVSEVTAADLEPICQAQGFPLRSVLGVDIPG